MEQLNTLRRHSVEWWEVAQKNLASIPQLSLDSFRRHPYQDGMKGTWERIDLPPIPRSSHSMDIISGCAYIFGGETNPHELVDNDMHVIRLPFSSAGADYFRVKARADVPVVASVEAQEEEQRDLDEVPLELSESSESSEASGDITPTSETKSKGKGKERAVEEKPILSDVPEPRVGHATATIGARIFVYGGCGGPDMKPLEEGGRVWIFDTRTNAWTYLDPVPAVKGGSIIPHPSPRSYHCATTIDRPRDFAPPPPKKPETWQEWALGDTSKTGIPQDPIIGHVAEDAVDEESDGYGTFFVHAGCLANGDRTSDLWAFDVRSRTWTELPAAPGPARGGSSICISKSRLFRFGGNDGEKELGGQLDFLDLQVEMFDDNITRGEVSVRAHGSWQSILENIPETSSAEIPAEPFQSWPAPRSMTSLHSITVGGGTEYLVLTMGEASPSADGYAGAGKYHNDVWMFQVPPLGMTAASITSAMLHAVGRKTGEGKWTKIDMGPYDEYILEMPRARGLLASAPMTDLEETGIVIWGGLEESNRRRGEGWILRLG